MNQDARCPEPLSRAPDYFAEAAGFRVDALAATLAGSLETGLNACVECCDRHAGDPERVALVWESQDRRGGTLTFAELKDGAARFANFLHDQGVRPGNVVAGMLPRTPDLLAVILGTWRAGAVYQPLFTAFGPKAIEQRLATGNARLLVIDATHRGKLDEVPGAPTVVIAGGKVVRPGDIDLRAELARSSADFAPVLRRGDDLFLMLSTSGTTGLPKAVPVPLKALLSFRVYMTDAVDLRPADRFWNIADPGWAYGLYYAVTGPLMLGHATTFYDGPFTVESTYRLIEKLGITNLAGSPTAFRLLLAAGSGAARPAKGRLRVVSSAGEPLNPEVIRWFAAHLAVPIADHYGQTELGMVVCNHHALAHPVHPGSAGLAMPGFRVAVLDEQNRELTAHRPGVLAVDIARSPLMWFGGYWQQPTPAIEAGYYRTGDVVELGDDGSISFRRTGRRHHHLVGLPDRAVRCGERADRARRGGRGGGGGQARRRANRNRQGFRGVGADACAVRPTGRGIAAVCQAPAVGACLSARGGFRGVAAENAERQAATFHAAQPGSGGRAAGLGLRHREGKADAD